MIYWNKDEVESFVEGQFSNEGFLDPNDFTEIEFAARGLVYSLLVGQKSEMATLRGDPQDALQKCPAFEIGCRCNLIGMSQSVYGGEAMLLYFVEDEGAEPSSADIRVALERLPNGRLYA